ncbi:hypothetical protein [Arthrobacter sp. ISL-30]|uniref:hypothetical protein n=1 Tax=Arthrobacter sp. ISL-30 TaxID=2819109 RepID=UPI001BE99171|nr:hypothetical protein [Arthrobacter sp. ISL-30]MBT2512482.1 hypothetical protein [Arthrobacter sp. ISL-30]
MTSSTRLTWAAAALTGAALLVSCEATGDPAPTSSPTKTESLTHDGQTIQPAAAEDCSTPSREELRSFLGETAKQIQAPAAKSSVKDGVTALSCTYSLVPVAEGQAADPGNAVIIATTTVPDQARLDSLGIPRLMMSAGPVAGMDKTWFSINKLSETTEYVLETVQGMTVIRAQLNLPAAGPEVSQAQEKLLQITGNRNKNR